ncbi:MAG: hypothetical protein CL610_03235 [Anaerolineaceae bacterium]|nr:hypothetical protein [Anaerolineaceae bacterium]
MQDETFPHRPTPKRPATGWQAWQATVGYIYAEHSSDVALTITAYPRAQGVVGWSASIMWGSSAESRHNEGSLASALCSLWSKIEASHTLFKSLDAAVRRPANYNDDEWLDIPTASALNRLLGITMMAFITDWRIAMIYQPVDNPDYRVRATLSARRDTVQFEVHAPSLRDTCQILYRSTASYYARQQ